MPAGRTGSASPRTRTRRFAFWDVRCTSAGTPGPGALPARGRSWPCDRSRHGAVPSPPEDGTPPDRSPGSTTTTPASPPRPAPWCSGARRRPSSEGSRDLGAVTVVPRPRVLPEVQQTEAARGDRVQEWPSAAARDRDRVDRPQEQLRHLLGTQVAAGVAAGGWPGGYPRRSRGRTEGPDDGTGTAERVGARGR